MGKVSEELKQKRITKLRSKIGDLNTDLDRQFEIIQGFEKSIHLDGPIAKSLIKMIEQYRLEHKKIANELSEIYGEILGIMDEKIYTKKEIDAILLRRDGKLNDWFNNKNLVV